MGALESVGGAFLFIGSVVIVGFIAFTIMGRFDDKRKEREEAEEEEREKNDIQV